MEKDTAPSYVSLHLTSKGRYYWDIKLNLSPATLTSEAADELKKIDGQLRQKFPNNVAEFAGGRGSFKEVNEFED